MSFNEKKTNYFAFKFGAYASFLTIGIKLLSGEETLFIISGIIITGLVNAHGIQLLHQASHYQAARNKKINNLAGTISGIFVLIPFESYRKSHFRHHKCLGTDKDIEFFGFETINHQSSYKALMNKIFGLHTFKSLGKSLIIKSPSKNYPELFILFIFLSAVILSVSTSSISILIYWLTSLIFVTEPVHFLIEIPEHYGCDKHSLDKFKNTRTILKASMPIRWFTNWNNFHSEHHKYPTVLPENLGQIAKNRNVDGNQCMKSYIEFYRFYLKHNLKTGSK